MVTLDTGNRTVRAWSLWTQGTEQLEHGHFGHREQEITFCTYTLATVLFFFLLLLLLVLFLLLLLLLLLFVASLLLFFCFL